MMKKQFRNRGFTLFIAIVVMGTLLLVSTGIINLSVKQAFISNSGRESQLAFYAADTGMECALYWDVKNTSATDSAFSTSTITTITCNKDENNPDNEWAVGGGEVTVIDRITFLPEPYCAKVTVTKNSNGTTEVESLGYNTCDDANPRRVERAVRASYGEEIPYPTPYTTPAYPTPPPPEPAVLTWSGPTSGSQDMAVTAARPFTAVGTYIVTVSRAMTVGVGGAAGGAGGAIENNYAGGGGGGSTGSSLISTTLVPSKSYRVIVGAGGGAALPGGPTSFYNITDGTYVFSLTGGSSKYGGGVSVGTGQSGGWGGDGGGTYEAGLVGGSNPAGTGGGGGSGGSCDWQVPGSGGAGGVGGYGVSGSGTSGAPGTVSCYSTTGGGGGGGWTAAGLPGYYGGGGGGGGNYGNGGTGGAGGNGAVIIRFVSAP